MIHDLHRYLLQLAHHFIIIHVQSMSIRNSNDVLLNHQKQNKNYDVKKHALYFKYGRVSHSASFQYQQMLLMMLFELVLQRSQSLISGGMSRGSNETGAGSSPDHHQVFMSCRCCFRCWFEPLVRVSAGKPSETLLIYSPREKNHKCCMNLARLLKRPQGISPWQFHLQHS